MPEIKTLAGRGAVVTSRSSRSRWGLRPPASAAARAGQATVEFTQRRGAFKKFMRELATAREAGLSPSLSAVVVITRENTHEAPALRTRRAVRVPDPRVRPHVAELRPGRRPPPTAGPRAPARSYPLHRMRRRPHVLERMAVRHGERLPSLPRPDDSAPAGRGRGSVPTRRHRRPNMTASGRLRRCSLQESCTTCMPLVKRYRKAGSSVDRYRQHARLGSAADPPARSTARRRLARARRRSRRQDRVRYLGHSDSRITRDIYQSVMPKAATEAAEAVNQQDGTTSASHGGAKIIAVRPRPAPEIAKAPGHGE